MEPEIFTDEENRAVGAIRTLFFQPPTTDLAEKVREVLDSLSSERKPEVLASALGQLRFEQAQRLNFVITSLFGTTGAIERPLAEVLVIKMGEGKGLEQIFGELGIDRVRLVLPPDQVPQEVFEQARIFSSLAKLLEQYFSSLLTQEKIAPLFPLIAGLSQDDLQAMASSIDEFFAGIRTLAGEAPLHNPGFPRPIVELLEKAKVSLVFNKFQLLGKKLEFLIRVRLICEALLASRRDGLSVDQERLQRLLGQWLYYTGTAPSSY